MYTAQMGIQGSNETLFLAFCYAQSAQSNNSCAVLNSFERFLSVFENAMCRIARFLGGK